MQRKSKALRLYRIVAALAFFLIAAPVHLAQHLAETTGALSAARVVDVAGFAEGDSGSGNGGNEGEFCHWCAFHADSPVRVGDSNLPSFHAAAAVPPVILDRGLVIGPQTLAASPRGPPEAA